jgi:exo-beta-1,3-glucanase (GH17 family)
LYDGQPLLIILEIEEKDMTSVIGMNLSNTFQSNPIPLASGAAQIAKLPVGLVKVFSTRGADATFWKRVSDDGLKVIVGIPNDDILNIAAGGDSAKLIINQIKPYAEAISWVCVGNEPLGSWYGDKYSPYLSKAVGVVYDVLQSSGLKNVGVTVPQNFEFMETSYPPSAGAIKQKFEQIIKDTCAVMTVSKAPFMVNIYPFITRAQNRNVVPLDYCLFTAKEDHWVHDGNYTYKNIFDAMIDALHVALDKIGYSNLEIVIGECGWPTAGDIDATPGNAKTFLQNLINHCKSYQGTPRLPNRQIRCFVFEMWDEDRKDTGPGQFEKYWGVCDGTGKPKFSLAW